MKQRLFNVFVLCCLTKTVGISYLLTYRDCENWVTRDWNMNSKIAAVMFFLKTLVKRGDKLESQKIVCWEAGCCIAGEVQGSSDRCSCLYLFFVFYTIQVLFFRPSKICAVQNRKWNKTISSNSVDMHLSVFVFTFHRQPLNFSQSYVTLHFWWRLQKVWRLKLLSYKIWNSAFTEGNKKI